MRYLVNVQEILMSEVIVEANSLESAKKKATEAVWDRLRCVSVCLHHDSDTQADGELLEAEWQKGGQYYDKQVVE